MPRGARTARLSATLFVVALVLGSVAALHVRGGAPPVATGAVPYAGVAYGLGSADPDLVRRAVPRTRLAPLVGLGVAAAAKRGAACSVVTLANTVKAPPSGCKTVSRQLLRDPFSGIEGQHETEAEPDSFAYGSTVVTVFQVGRSGDGAGALVNGFATSKNAGRTWRAGAIPRLTAVSTPAGPYERASDPAVAYDAVHRAWLVSSVVLSNTGAEVVVSRSRDGVAWEAPVSAVGAQDESPDKEWIVCDNWPQGPFRGSCYLAYFDLDARVIAVRSSRDGGATWSQRTVAASASVRDAIVNGAQPVVLRDGALVVLYSVFESTQANTDEVVAVRSNDGGASFAAPARVAALYSEDVTGLRAPAFVSAEVAGDGRIWAAWSDCRFRPDCDANDIVLSRSTDGVSWTAPVRVPAPATAITLSHVLPGLGVDPTSSGAKTRLGIVFYSVQPDIGCGYAFCASLDAGFVGSRNAGRTWTSPLRLAPRSARLDWTADGEIGAFVGDYMSTSWVGGRPIPVFVVAAPPVLGELRQAVFAATTISGFAATAR